MADELIMSYELASLIGKPTSERVTFPEVIALVDSYVVQNGLDREERNATGGRIYPNPALARVTGIQPLTRKAVVGKVREHTKPAPKPGKSPDEVKAAAGAAVDEYLQDLKRNLDRDDSQLAGNYSDSDLTRLRQEKKDLEKKFKRLGEEVREAEENLIRCREQIKENEEASQAWTKDMRKELQEEYAAVNKAWGDWDVDVLLKYGVITKTLANDIKTAMGE